MNRPCLLCGAEAVDRHHPTGRGSDLRYLDPRFTVPCCHDDHELLHDDLRTAGLETTSGRVGFLDKLELALRRMGLLLGRLPGVLGGLLWHLARWCADKADGLRAVIAALDAGMPGWRSLPGMP